MAVMTCGAVMSRIFYGKVGAAYGPTLAWMTGLDDWISLRKGKYDAEEYISSYKDSTRKEAQGDFDKGIFDGAMNGWARYVSYLSSTNELTSH